MAEQSGATPTSPSGEVSQAITSLTSARFKLEGEKKGLQSVLVQRASWALDQMIRALAKMKEDLKNAGL